jgi:hypothetical protein
MPQAINHTNENVLINLTWNWKINKLIPIKDRIKLFPSSIDHTLNFQTRTN